LDALSTFETRFVIPYEVCCVIFNHANFEKTFPEVRVISREDAFLALLYRLNKGCEFSTVADVFGGSPDTHSRTFGKYLDASLVFFKNTIAIPSKNECTDMKMKLLKHGFPNPQAIFIGEAYFFFLLKFFLCTGDCIDSGIHTTDSSWYTPKASCTSKHAVRVFSFTFDYFLKTRKKSFVVVNRLSCEFVYCRYENFY